MTVDPNLSVISIRKSQVLTTFKKVEPQQSLMIPQFVYQLYLHFFMKHNRHIVQIHPN